MAILLHMQKRAISKARLCQILFEFEWLAFSLSNPMVYLKLSWCFSSLAVLEIPVSSAFCWLLRVRAICQVIDLYPTKLREMWATFRLLVLKVLILTGSKIHTVMSTGQAGGRGWGKGREEMAVIPNLSVVPGYEMGWKSVWHRQTACSLYKQTHKWGKFCSLTSFVMKDSHIFVWNKSMTLINTS